MFTLRPIQSGSISVRIWGAFTLDHMTLAANFEIAEKFKWPTVVLSMLFRQDVRRFVESLCFLYSAFKCLYLVLHCFQLLSAQTPCFFNYSAMHWYTFEFLWHPCSFSYIVWLPHALFSAIVSFTVQIFPRLADILHKSAGRPERARR